MGIIGSTIYFTDELPLLRTVIVGLEQLTGEKIACENFEEDGIFCFAKVSSEVAGSEFTLMSITEGLGYETWWSLSVARYYLVDALAVVLLELGGSYEYASLLPAGARQPWQVERVVPKSIAEALRYITVVARFEPFNQLYVVRTI